MNHVEAPDASRARPYRYQGELMADHTSMRIATGYDELDHLLGGGLERGAVTVVGARPTFGKTSFAFNVAAGSARRGERTIVGTMGESPGDAAALLQRLWGDHDGAGCEVVDETSTTPGCLGDTLRANASGIDLVVFDGLRTMVEQPFDVWTWSVAALLSQLRTVAEEHGCAVLMPTRLAPFDARRTTLRPTLSDVPAAVASASDTVLLLHQPGRPGIDVPIAPASDVEVIVAQHRFAPSDGSLTMTYLAGDRRFQAPLEMA